MGVNLKVDFCSHEAAKYAVMKWHYSKAMPAGKLIKIGVWENESFTGVIIFSRGATVNIGKPFGLNQTEVCELTRVALSKHNCNVSRIISLGIKLLKKYNEGLRLIVSYADSGQGHLGIIYQAGNWLYSGYHTGEIYININGHVMHRRSVHAKYGTSSIEKLKGSKKVYASGKYKYLMPLDKKMRKKIEVLRKPYPKELKNA